MILDRMRHGLPKNRGEDQAEHDRIRERFERRPGAHVPTEVHGFQKPERESEERDQDGLPLL